MKKQVLIFCITWLVFCRVYGYYGNSFTNFENPKITIEQTIKKVNSINGSSAQVCSISQKLSLGLNSCKNWEEDFSSFQNSMKNFKSAIESEFRTQNQGVLPDCKPVPTEAYGRKDVGTNLGREGSIDLNTVSGVSDTLKNLGKFKYRVIPPREAPPKGQPIKTVFMFAGGPGNVLSKDMKIAQFQNAQIIVADYIGMGDNTLPQVRSGVDDQDMNLNIYAELIEKIVQVERAKFQMGDYVLQGHSFGSVGATVVGAHLSNSTNLDASMKPKAVILSGVVDYVDGHQTRNTTPIKGIDWVPRVSANKICILPEGASCFDDRIFQSLTRHELDAVRKKIERIYSSFDPQRPTAMQSFLRDAFHWSAASSPEIGVAFLRNYFLPENSSTLYCWYKDYFDQIPWISRVTGPSMSASIESHSCTTIYAEPKICSCFKRNKPYTSDYQIAAPTKILYVNGDQDSQTPLAGAKNHFDSQKNKNKKFLKVCAGHGIFPMSPNNKSVDFEDLVSTGFDETGDSFD